MLRATRVKAQVKEGCSYKRAFGIAILLHGKNRDWVCFKQRHHVCFAFAQLLEASWVRARQANPTVSQWMGLKLNCGEITEMVIPPLWDRQCWLNTAEDSKTSQSHLVLRDGPFVTTLPYGAWVLLSHTT